MKRDAIKEADTITRELKEKWIQDVNNQLEEDLIDLGAATKDLAKTQVSAEKKRKFKIKIPPEPGETQRTGKPGKCINGDDLTVAFVLARQVRAQQSDGRGAERLGAARRGARAGSAPLPVRRGTS